MTDEGDLPEGWATSEMGEVAEVVGGGTPKADEPSFFSDSGHVWLTPADLSDFDDVFISRGRRRLSDTGLQSCSARLVPKGTVLMSSRAPIGYLAIAANELCTNQGFKSFVLLEGLDPQFVYYWLKFKRDDIEDMGSGSTFLEVSGSKCKTIPICFPPLAEQRRIVAAVEKLLDAVSSARARLERVPALLRQFRLAVLAAACSGRLTSGTSESRIDSEEHPGSRQEVWLGDLLVAGPQNGIYKPQSAYGSGTSILRIDNFRGGRIEAWSELKRVRLTSAEEAQYGLVNDDIVINRVNSPKHLGKSAVVRGLVEPAVFESNMMRVRLDSSRARSDFVGLFLQSPLGRDRLQANAKHAVNQSSINQVDVQQVAVPLPPLAEQAEIVRRVSALFAHADALERRAAAALRRVEGLTPAVLAKAFRGELVPTEAELARREGRTYEPAADLLARIRAAAPAAPKPRRGRKPTP